MKKIVCTALAALTALSLFAGCQKSPDSPIVIGKNIDNMIDKAAEEPVVADINSGGSLRAPLEAPEKLALDAGGQKGNLTVHADADIVVPNTSSMPVARVTKGQFSEEDVKNLYQALAGEAKSIKADSSPQSDYYLQQVQKLREIKDTGNYDEKITAEDIDSQIEALTAQAASAPDSYEYTEPDFSFKENKDENAGPIGSYARLCFTPDGKTISEIYVVQDSYGTGARAEYTRNKYSEGTAVQAEPAVSKEDAQKAAQDVMDRLGLTDFVCAGGRESAESLNTTSGFHPGAGLHEFMFTRAINNAPITYTDDDGLTTVHDANSQPWMFEKINIFIDGGGVCYLQWNSPYIVKEIVSEASSMLPFSDIENVLKTMLPVKYDYMDSDDIYSCEMNITEVRLGLMRITEKDVGDSGLVIPVWDAFGTLTKKGKPGMPNPEEGTESYAYTPFITINAVDGSIIDRSLGY